MNRKRTITAIVIVAVVIVLVVAGTFVITVRPSADGTYTESASSVSAPLHGSATNGQLALKVNNISVASDPEMAAVWTNLSLQARDAGVYYRALENPPGAKNLIANITVMNTQRAPVPFSYTDFFLVGRSGNTYYANYAVCNSSCSADALKNRTLTSSFASDLYVLFSVPATAETAKLVYASSPPLEMALM